MGVLVEAQAVAVLRGAEEELVAVEEPDGMAVAAVPVALM